MSKLKEALKRMFALYLLGFMKMIAAMLIGFGFYTIDDPTLINYLFILGGILIFDITPSYVKRLIEELKSGFGVWK